MSEYIALIVDHHQSIVFYRILFSLTLRHSIKAVSRHSRKSQILSLYMFRAILMFCISIF